MINDDGYTLSGVRVGLGVHVGVVVVVAEYVGVAVVEGVVPFVRLAVGDAEVDGVGRRVATVIVCT